MTQCPEARDARGATSRRGAYKRPSDLVLLLIAHTFPLLLRVWLLLWTTIPLMVWLGDRGPIFYRQRRVGMNGSAFSVLKFRTMVVDAERSTGPVWASSHDPRITRVGRLLRRTGLDELPQVINIFKGDMSFVGPRSERPELHDKFVRELPDFQKRLLVRPGLTGLAQVNGGYNMAPGDKLEHDLDYIARMNLWLDVKLILISVRNTLLARWDRRDAKPAAGGRE